jgi:hypothetical protein
LRNEEIRHYQARRRDCRCGDGRYDGGGLQRQQFTVSDGGSDANTGPDGHACPVSGSGISGSSISGPGVSGSGVSGRQQHSDQFDQRANRGAAAQL